MNFCIFGRDSNHMNPKARYQERVKEISSQRNQLKSRLRLLGFLRLLVFLVMGFNTYFFFGDYAVLSFTYLLGIVLFLYLVSIHTNVKAKYRFVRALLDINTTELRRLDGDFSDADTGQHYVFELHDFNQDIDLYGEGSLFQSLNRTQLINGERKLAQWLNSNDTTHVIEKQRAIQELKEWVSWRQEYAATAKLISSKLQAEHVLEWMQGHTFFVPKIYAWLPYVFSVITLSAFTALGIGLISWVPVFLWLSVGVVINAPYVKRITQVYQTTSEIDDLLRQYAKLLQRIESAEFQSEQLKGWKHSILTDGKAASSTLKELSQQIDALGNRNILLFGFLANMFFLWDLRFTYRIELWIRGFNGALGDWFNTVERFDAINSMANYAFNHPSYIYPKLTEDPKLQLRSTSLGHPLIQSEKMVTNDFSIDHEDFFIITGANMAGKSTFLRTVAMNIVMANCGLPICAASFEYRPVKLISSMRTSDSLVNDESYFFSELKRLKYIVGKIEEENYFIILDEILKGTNSVDKAEGSKKFVERLVNSKSTGLIATHDLSLCSLADSYNEIQNYYFDAEIVDDELYFDYRFKKGVCQNMNASFLLKKMGIVAS